MPHSNNPGAFQLEMEVRDSEVDYQGIVSNLVYPVYMAHARHKHLQELGIGFAEMHGRGYDLVLVRCEIDYKASLRPGDRFIVTSQLEPCGRIRFNFVQSIIRLPDGALIAHGLNTGTCIACTTRRPCLPPELKCLLATPVTESVV